MVFLIQEFLDFFLHQPNVFGSFIHFILNKLQSSSQIFISFFEIVFSNAIDLQEQFFVRVIVVFGQSDESEVSVDEKVVFRSLLAKVGGDILQKNFVILLGEVDFFGCVFWVELEVVTQENCGSVEGGFQVDFHFDGELSPS